MKARRPQTRSVPVLPVKTALKAGYYLGLTLSAGAGTGASGPATASPTTPSPGVETAGVPS